MLEIRAKYAYIVTADDCETHDLSGRCYDVKMHINRQVILNCMYERMLGEETTCEHKTGANLATQNLSTLKSPHILSNYSA